MAFLESKPLDLNGTLLTVSSDAGSNDCVEESFLSKDGQDVRNVPGQREGDGGHQ